MEIMDTYVTVLGGWVAWDISHVRIIPIYNPGRFTQN